MFSTRQKALLTFEYNFSSTKKKEKVGRVNLIFYENSLLLTKYK